MSRPSLINIARLPSGLLIPNGKRCSDCAHVDRCVRLGFTKRDNRTCDFAPTRFREARPT